MRDGRGLVVVELTRRNLQALLAKLDGHPAGSLRTIVKQGVAVRAVEDESHYADEVPGRMHSDTEARL